MKAYTDLNQSKKLSEILPLESADMFLAMNGTLPVMSKYIEDGCVTADDTAIPCWSLAALLNVLPYPFLSELSNEIWKCGCYPSGICYYVAADSPIDACYEMIIKLHELKML